jgi:HPt (histidine-containing phosphotransfer) domain-containing protein
MDLVTVAEHGDSLCDLDCLLDSLAGNQAVATRLAELFLKMYPNTLGELDRASRQGDLAALRRVVHEIRNSCALFSAEHCVALARKLEDELLDGLAPDLQGDCALLKADLEHVAQELREFLAGIRPDG